MDKEDFSDKTENFTSVIAESRHLEIGTKEDKQVKLSEEPDHSLSDSCKNEDEFCTLHGVEEPIAAEETASVKQESVAEKTLNFEKFENAERGKNLQTVT